MSPQRAKEWQAERQGLNVGPSNLRDILGGSMGRTIGGAMGSLFGPRLRRPDPNRLGGENRQGNFPRVLPNKPGPLNPGPRMPGILPNDGFNPKMPPYLPGGGKGKDFWEGFKFPWSGEKPEKNMGHNERRQRQQFPFPVGPRPDRWATLHQKSDPNRLIVM